MDESTAPPPPSPNWKDHLRPLWIGTAIGLGVGIILQVLIWIIDAEPTQFWATTQGKQGTSSASYSTAATPAAMVVFGCLGGLLVALWRKSKSDS
jgi:hypothetical protein